MRKQEREKRKELGRKKNWRKTTIRQWQDEK